MSQLEKEGAIGIQWLEARNAANGPAVQGNRMAPTADNCTPHRQQCGGRGP